MRLAIAAAALGEVGMPTEPRFRRNCSARTDAESLRADFSAEPNSWPSPNSREPKSLRAELLPPGAGLCEVRDDYRARCKHCPLDRRDQVNGANDRTRHAIQEVNISLLSNAGETRRILAEFSYLKKLRASSLIESIRPSTPQVDRTFERGLRAARCVLVENVGRLARYAHE